MKIRSSINTATIAVEREFTTSVYDAIKAVGDITDEVVITANNVDSINTVANNINDLLSISEVTGSLTASADGVSYNTEASAELVGSDIQIKVPAGLPGVDGENGKSPEYVFTYDDITGDFSYELVGYIDESSIPIQEA